MRSVLKQLVTLLKRSIVKQLVTLVRHSIVKQLVTLRRRSILKQLVTLLERSIVKQVIILDTFGLGFSVDVAFLVLSLSGDFLLGEILVCGACTRHFTFK